MLTAALSASLAGTLTPAAAAPSSAADAKTLVEQTGAQLSQLDEQVHQAEAIVAQQQQAATDAAAQAAAAKAAVDAYGPQLQAIAKSGISGSTQSRLAAFLTSESAADLVDQMTTLDMIASHVQGVISAVAAAQAQAAAAQAAADQAAAQAQSSLAQLQAQQQQLQQQADQYEADFKRLSAAEQAQVSTALGGPSLSAPNADVIVSGVANEVIATAIRTALAQVGKPYVFGASGPNGFDCSGLTMFAYAAAGVSLPHSSSAQSRLGVAVSRSELQPGDLVYFYSPVSHVGLYIGNGMMVHARTYGQPVAVTTVDMNGYAGARRIITGG
ncbi:C40 family peptidase [Petropleomorpha daqingensis]|uniref:Cell wall-associated NlpC family hydrolase n=1 Tax=Petropleomorpha daqingensis TaxID=2026353 RepID=A0A853CB61_9ACTN|nr:cell wall-associated NlpC family hydrolase [Petropleomorpha daqingensis]